jgi:hypothetical protein
MAEGVEGRGHGAAAGTSLTTDTVGKEPLVVRAVLAFKANRRWFGGLGLAVFGPLLVMLNQGLPRRLLIVSALLNLCTYLMGAGAHGSDREQKERQARRRARRLAELQ